MTKQTKALKMAIEWLDNQQLGYSGHSVRKACQEALAETQEPLDEVVRSFLKHVQSFMKDGKHISFDEVYIKPQEALEQPPSREWQSLSDEEIWDIANFLGKNKEWDYPVMFAKTIERALREKNNAN